MELIAAFQVHVEGGRLLGRWTELVTRPVIALVTGTARTAQDAVLGLGSLSELLASHHRQGLALEESRALNHLLQEDLAAARETQSLSVAMPFLSEAGLLSRCLYRDLGAGIMEVSAGRAEGISADNPAIGAGGVVGRVVHAGYRRSRLELVTSPAAAVAVRTQRTAIPGLAVGSGTNTLDVRYVPVQAQVLRGALLVTGGEDGIYPPGLPVARVISVRETGGPFLEISAAPTADLARLRVVLLLASWPGPSSAETAP